MCYELLICKKRKNKTKKHHATSDVFLLATFCSTTAFLLLTVKKKKKKLQKTQNFFASLHVKFTLRSKDLESFSLAWQSMFPTSVSAPYQ